MMNILEKLDDIRRTDCEHPPVAHPEFVFDRAQLDDKEPLTKTEIELINTQLNGAIRKFALDCGCAEHDVLRLKAEYWHSEEGHGFKDNNYVWGLFYDCNQKNYENKRSLSDTPQKMENFLYLFGKNGERAAELAEQISSERAAQKRDDNPPTLTQRFRDHFLSR